jgi:outer membrane protein assembly factor BamB
MKAKALTVLFAIASAALFANSASAQITDWPMWGGTNDRNMVSEMEGGVSLDFDMNKGTNVVWSKGIGSQTYGNPVVANGNVYVGTNNGGGFRPKHPKEDDKGILLCFDEKTGDFKWQLTREKLPSGRVNDWPLQGICSTPVIEGDRLWVVTNRCELMCVDTKGFENGNDGDVQDEPDNEVGDADIIWNLDMMGDELGVFPHNLATSSPLIHGDNIYLLTSNGVDEAHLEVPSPRAPCFLCVNKNTGEVVWEAGQPGDAVLHGQWGSPSVGIVNGKAQVYFPGGDGWLYAHDAETGEEIWKFDLNPKETKWELGGAGLRNSVIATPVFYENSVILAVGQDPEHGEGVGHLWRVDATKTGDVSAELGEIQTKGKPNPNSGVIWHYGGTKADSDEAVFRRTMSTVAIKDGLLFAADLSGFVHCIDFKTGARKWEHDLLSGVWGSTVIVDGKVFLGNEDGTLTVFKASGEKAEVLAEISTTNYSAIYSTPTFANGKLFLSDRARIYCIDVQAGK